MLVKQTPDDITGQEIERLLGELSVLSGQEAAARPVLELLIGAILTRTSVEPEGEDLNLCVTGLLPATTAPVPPGAVVAAALDAHERAECELLWHADLGRHILVRKIALRLFTDARSVMDAILDTADLAQRCLDRIDAA